MRRCSDSSLGPPGIRPAEPITAQAAGRGSTHPQHHAWPAAVRAQVCRWPAEMVTKEWPPATRTGTFDDTLPPLPSCPEVPTCSTRARRSWFGRLCTAFQHRNSRMGTASTLTPQHQAAPEACRPQVCSAPALMVTNSLVPSRRAGVPWASAGGERKRAQLDGVGAQPRQHMAHVPYPPPTTPTPFAAASSLTIDSLPAVGRQLLALRGGWGDGGRRQRQQQQAACGRGSVAGAWACMHAHMRRRGVCTAAVGRATGTRLTTGSTQDAPSSRHSSMPSLCRAGGRVAAGWSACKAQGRRRSRGSSWGGRGGRRHPARLPRTDRGMPHAFPKPQGSRPVPGNRRAIANGNTCRGGLPRRAALHAEGPESAESACTPNQDRCVGARAKNGTNPPVAFKGLGVQGGCVIKARNMAQRGSSRAAGSVLDACRGGARTGLCPATSARRKMRRAAVAG